MCFLFSEDCIQKLAAIKDDRNQFTTNYENL